MLALLKTAAVQLLVSNSDAVEGDEYSGWDAETTVVRLALLAVCSDTCV